MIDLPTGISLNPETIIFLDEFPQESNDGNFPTRNPANGQVLAYLPLADEAAVDEAVNAARNAFPNWRDKVTPADRAKLLLRLAELMERDVKIFQELECLDNGKPLNKAAYDVASAIKHFRYYAGWS
ncbi:MAG: aldehyde dehydrogenase family protein, partial [Bacteroidota bacterium]